LLEKRRKDTQIIVCLYIYFTCFCKIIAYFCAMQTIIIGGGAAGFFGAIAVAEANPNARITILERGNSFLQKVKVSGGGRCNVTHACFDVRELTRNYPRGSKELAGPFTRFGPTETIMWFEQRGVKLKTESDGRMFPETDESQTIIDCLWQATKKHHIDLKTSCRVDQISPIQGNRWRVTTANEVLEADAVLVTTGSSEAIWTMLSKLGHRIVSPVPSLFTFNTKDQRLQNLAGIAVPNAQVTLPDFKQQSNGPLLVTHWGLSGPAILKLSAWAARELHAMNYHFKLTINWLGDITQHALNAQLIDIKSELSKKQVIANAQFGLPARLWQSLCAAAGIADLLRWADMNKKQLNALCQELGACAFDIKGKSTFKEEFVTAGGIDLKEINFKNFESKLFPNLYFAGEVLNIDAVTGGFNFQAAWTGGWIAGGSIGGRAAI
jgi:predicted Rossmann fold flavoprotein